jgi:hypothetical protein
MKLVIAAASALAFVSAVPKQQGFGSSVQDSSDTCQAAIASLPADLTTCYTTTSLYFAPASQVCEASCLAPTIAGAKTVAAACSGIDSNIATHQVYVDWSNEQAATAACATASNGKHCLEFIASSMVAVDSLLLFPTTPSPAQLEKIGCNEACTKALYAAVDGQGSKAPSLYYYGNTRMDKLFGAWASYCNWS